MLVRVSVKERLYWVFFVLFCLLLFFLQFFYVLGFTKYAHLDLFFAKLFEKDKRMIIFFICYLRKFFDSLGSLHMHINTLTEY